MEKIMRLYGFSVFTSLWRDVYVPITVKCLVTTPSEAYRSRNLSLQKGFLSPCRFVNLGEQEDVLRSPSVPQFPPHCSVSLTITCLQVGDSPV
jgi:hypothetical protein